MSMREWLGQCELISVTSKEEPHACPTSARPRSRSRSHGYCGWVSPGRAVRTYLSRPKTDAVIAWNANAGEAALAACIAPTGQPAARVADVRDDPCRDP